MNRGFLFDMDGVVIDSEPTWEEYEREYLPDFFGKEVSANMGSLVGLGVMDILNRATELGAIFDKAKYLAKADSIAELVYTRSPITPGVGQLAERLTDAGFRLGLVSQSPQHWIDKVLPRLPFKARLETVISLHEHSELARKPSPDGYIAALQHLSAEPERSVILEDSNLGIKAAKAANAYVIGFNGNLLKGYEQTGADAYANTMGEVISLVEKFIRP